MDPSWVKVTVQPQRVQGPNRTQESGNSGKESTLYHSYETLEMTGER